MRVQVSRDVEVKGLLCWAAVRRKDFKTVHLARLGREQRLQSPRGGSGGVAGIVDGQRGKRRAVSGLAGSGSRAPSQGSDKSGRTGGVSDPSSNKPTAEALAMNQDAGWECKAELPLQQIVKSRAGNHQVLVLIL